MITTVINKLDAVRLKRTEALRRAGYEQVQDPAILGIIEQYGDEPPAIAVTKGNTNWPTLDREYWAKAEDVRAAFVIQESTNGRAAERFPWRRSRLDAISFIHTGDSVQLSVHMLKRP